MNSTTYFTEEEIQMLDDFKMEKGLPVFQSQYREILKPRGPTKKDALSVVRAVIFEVQSESAKHDILFVAACCTATELSAHIHLGISYSAEDVVKYFMNPLTIERLRDLDAFILQEEEIEKCVQYFNAALISDRHSYEILKDIMPSSFTIDDDFVSESKKVMFRDFVLGYITHNKIVTREHLKLRSGMFLHVFLQNPVESFDVIISFYGLYYLRGIFSFVYNGKSFDALVMKAIYNMRITISTKFPSKDFDERTIKYGACLYKIQEITDFDATVESILYTSEYQLDQGHDFLVELDEYGVTEEVKDLISNESVSDEIFRVAFEECIGRIFMLIEMIQHNEGLKVTLKHNITDCILFFTTIRNGITMEKSEQIKSVISQKLDAMISMAHGIVNPQVGHGNDLEFTDLLNKFYVMVESVISKNIVD